ncbi:AzlD domain-containing protein [Modestobacter marinus]|uniref:AzlD domain-containing protein n=1 Tax=Modestobacter marinus TaxID=477641 RepID=UPI001C95C722|nr:AzlD domain-containing protein [Modestobacter marinus]
MTALVAWAGAAAVTWLLRVPLITLVPAGQLPGPVRRALPHVGPAVLAPVIAAALVGGPGGVDPAFLAGAVVTAAVAWRRGSVVLATVCRLGTVALLHLL